MASNICHCGAMIAKQSIPCDASHPVVSLQYSSVLYMGVLVEWHYNTIAMVLASPMRK